MTSLLAPSRIPCVVAVAVVATFAVAHAQSPVTARSNWAVASGGNDHCYQAFAAPGGIDYGSAAAYADSIGAELATITSAEENAFVHALISGQPALWTASGTATLGPWIGGERHVSGAFRWVTREPWGYENWAFGQPDNSCSLRVEDRVHFFGAGGSPAPTWNDLPRNGCPGAGIPVLPTGFVVEFPTCDNGRFDWFTGTARDGEFERWWAEDRSTDGSSTSVLLPNPCGSPGAGMRVQLCPTPTSAVPYAYAIAVAWSRNAVLDPGANPFCATTVAMQIDHLAIASGGSGQAVHPVIGQGSSLYALPQWQTTAVPGSWTTMTLGPVPITSFHRLTSPYSFDPSRTPDLGPSAAPLTFGLMFRNSSGVTAYCTTHCYDNWQVTLSCEATFTTGHCPGCAGCTGVPVLGAIGLPVIPNPAFALTVQNACPNSPTVFVASLSRSGCQGVGVPLPLDMHGFPGCTLCVCPDVLFFNITDGGGNATQPFPIGPNTDYLGLPVHLQAFVLGPPFHATPKAVAVLGR